MEDFVPFLLAKKLKEKGFNYPCIGHYVNNQLYVAHYQNAFHSDNNESIDAPTISQVLKWLREEKKIFVAINICYCYESYEKPFPTNHKMEPILKGYYYGVWDLGNLNDKNALSEYFESPELAALAGIEYVIDNNLI